MDLLRRRYASHDSLATSSSGYLEREKNQKKDKNKWKKKRKKNKKEKEKRKEKKKKRKKVKDNRLQHAKREIDRWEN